MLRCSITNCMTGETATYITYVMVRLLLALYGKSHLLPTSKMYDLNKKRNKIHTHSTSLVISFRPFTRFVVTDFSKPRLCTRQNIQHLIKLFDHCSILIQAVPTATINASHVENVFKHRWLSFLWIQPTYFGLSNTTCNEDLWRIWSHSSFKHLADDECHIRIYEQIQQNVPTTVTRHQNFIPNHQRNRNLIYSICMQVVLKHNEVYRGLSTT